LVLDVETGHFSKDGTGGNGKTQVVSTGFTPKAIIMWAENETTANEENTTDTDTGYSYGFSDGTNDRCLSTASSEGNATSDAHRTLRNDSVWSSMTPDGSNNLRARGSIAFGTNQFTMTYDIQSTETTLIHYKIYGGADLTDIDVASFTMASATGTQNVATNIANADFVCIICCNDSVSSNTVTTPYGESLGFATSATQRWCVGPRIQPCQVRRLPVPCRCYQEPQRLS